MTRGLTLLLWTARLMWGECLELRVRPSGATVLRPHQRGLHLDLGDLRRGAGVLAPGPDPPPGQRF